ncbi:hypothetical protein DD563_02780 [Pelagicola sp. LXJ1103]|nr:hypothetical protein DD563_02780 [Pelagicola sp. LXJ1103]
MRTAEDMGTYFSRSKNFDTIERHFILDAVGWSAFSHNLAMDDRLPYSATSLSKQPNKTFKLAVLEGNIRFAKTEGGDPQLWLDKSHGALRSNCAHPPSFDELKAVFLEQIKWAIDDGASVIIAGEFACPSCDDEAEFEVFLGEIRNLVREAPHPVFVVAGSRHVASDQGTAQPHNSNIAMLFGGDPTEADFEKKLIDQPIRHYKRAPSISLGERIFSPVSPELPIYITPFSSFGMLVCSDAFDTQIQFSYLRQNMKTAPRAQIIFVPAFNTSDQFYQSCRYLSYLANATVIVVNSHPDDFPSSSVKFYTAGIEAGERLNCMKKRPDDFGNMPDGEKDRIKDATRHLNNSPDIKIGQTSRRVATYNIDRVMLETFSKILRKNGGALLRKSFDLSSATM